MEAKRFLPQDTDVKCSLWTTVSCGTRHPDHSPPAVGKNLVGLRWEGLRQGVRTEGTPAYHGCLEADLGIPAVVPPTGRQRGAGAEASPPPFSEDTTLVNHLRLVTYNTLFGGRDDAGLGSDRRWQAAAPFLKSLEGDVYALQECNFWDLLGEQRLHLACNQLGRSSAFLARANRTTTGHRFHTALIFGPRWRITGHGAERNNYHHVLGWATARLDDDPTPWDFRNIHLSPFSPAKRAQEVEPLIPLAAPGRRSALLGDGNMLGINHSEPDWSRLPDHLRGTQLLPGPGPLRADRTAVDALQRAGFIDPANLFNNTDPTGGFDENDVRRRQDFFLLNPALSRAVVSYTVHREPVDNGWSDHAAACLVLDCDALAG